MFTYCGSQPPVVNHLRIAPPLTRRGREEILRVEFDRLLTILENPVRRRIIQRLSQEPSYPLELAGQIGVHQQLVAKHLKVMEEAELVEASRESSPYGPDRRMYGLTKSMSVTIDFSPELYGTHMLSFEDASLRPRHEEAREFEERVNRLAGEARIRAGINAYAELIADIDRRIEELDEERVALLRLRSLAMRAAKENIGERVASPLERLVVYHILNRNVRTARDISRSLDLEEKVITQILNRLKTTWMLR